eukprot:TRINITY_DN13824_c0_g1_i1.p1 TRINITY_DN13824_c0_g1~~TRINITY_DN13824_c0_g1_i1.p1  ORF type:complete len:444 (+),score=85.88 TRINITY_DN13824_c0_g1_i1:71-1333(+)
MTTVMQGGAYGMRDDDLDGDEEVVLVQTGHVWAPYYECGGRKCGRAEDPDILLDDNWNVVYTNTSISRLPFPPLYRVVVNPRSQSYDRVCVLFHGLGGGEMHPHQFGDPLMGDLFRELDCRRIYLPRFPTHEIVDGWENSWLQEIFVHMIKTAGYDPHQPSKTRIFAHGLGNLILAGAVAEGRFRDEKGTCLYGEGTAFRDGEEITTCAGPQWFMAQGPLRGSQAVNVLWNLCHDTVNSLETTFGFAIQQMQLGAEDLQFLTRFMGKCSNPFQRPEGLFTSHGYFSLRPSHPRLANSDIYRTAYRYLAGAMCGTTPDGVEGTQWRLGMTFLAQLTRFHELNDGLVGLSSCADEAHNWKDDWKVTDGQWYKVRANHIDGTGAIKEAKECSMLEGFSRTNLNERVKDQCPIKWFAQASRGGS